MATIAGNGAARAGKAKGNVFTAAAELFLGQTADWYKLTIVGFLILNPILLATAGSFVTGWVLLLEFIFTLAMALKCYPLQPGGLLVIQALLLGLASTDDVFHETEANFEVILLLIFMVAGITFLRDLLLFLFTRILTGIRSKTLLSVTFLIAAAVLSAFMDALTVTAVIITVMYGFYGLYHKVASGIGSSDDDEIGNDDGVQALHAEDLARFRAFLRSLVMHAAVGTTLGGVMTLVGEPQNLLIGTIAGWDFQEFFVRMAPVSVPVFFVGLAVCVAAEKLKLVGYGAPLPEAVRHVLHEFAAEQDAKRTTSDRGVLVVQAAVSVFLIAALTLQLAPVGIIGLCVIVFATAFAGIVEESRLGHAFREALPFTALLVVFFGVVAVIHRQDLFAPLITFVLERPPTSQPGILFLVNGLLSAISDNVFVATVYMTEIEAAFEAGTIGREQFDLLAVAINTGTNIPSVATPNGQAAFLFLLTSALAPLIRLSYFRMVLMALPYTVCMTIAGYLAVVLLL